MSLIVQKFGGSSVANWAKVENVARRVTDTYKEGNSVVVVVSAQGDTTDDFLEKAAEIKMPQENLHPFKAKEKKTPGEAPNRGPAEIRHVDTRTSNINIDKYNEKYETIAPANSMKDNYSRKQKIKQKSQDYKRPQGAKRETEADKMRRMQLERIKKTPITVTVGDEITVGELAAAIITDSVVRLLPGAIGDEASALTDCFQDDLLAPPVYTRPAEFNGWKVPEVLLAGNFAEIEKWQDEQAWSRTKALRPDLISEK